MRPVKLIVTLILILMISFTGCSMSEKSLTMEPSIIEMKEICNLATLECYYHNVAKFDKPNADGFWIFEKDKRFWMEYDSIVKIGIDLDKVNMQIEGNQVTITIPNASVLSCIIDENSLTADSFIVDKDSADITAEDEKLALINAQNQLTDEVNANNELFDLAKDRAKLLLEEYIMNIGKMIDVDYQITWKEI